MKMRIPAIVILLIIGFQNSAFCQQKGYLKIIVNVESVNISIDNKDIGPVNPNELVIKEISLGSHQVTATKEGYQKQVKDINLSVANEVKEIKFELSRPQSFVVDKDVSSGILGIDYGGLNIVVKSNGQLVPAKVYIDDKFADNAPVNIKKLYAGSHTIKIEYNSFTRTYTEKIEKDKINNLEVELLQKINLNLISEQSDINCILDGFRKYTVPSEISIDEGNHSIDFKKQDYIPASINYYFSSNYNYNIKISLSKTLPYVSEYNVGRVNKQPYNAYSFTKPETKVVQNDKKLWRTTGYVALAGAIIGGIIGSVTESEEGGTNAAAGVLVGGVLGFGIGFGIGNNHAGTIEVPDEVNIRYNKEEVPKMVKDKNSEIDIYNAETQRLIKEKQVDLYNKQAIKIETR